MSRSKRRNRRDVAKVEDPFADFMKDSFFSSDPFFNEETNDDDDDFSFGFGGSLINRHKKMLNKMRKFDIDDLEDMEDNNMS